MRLEAIIGRVLISLDLSNKLEISARKIGFLIFYGPEIRTLLSSGLLDQVIKSGDKPVIFSRFEISDVGLADIGAIETYILPEGNPSYWRKFNGLFSSWLLKYLKAHQRYLGFGNFHWSNGYRGSTSKSDFWSALVRFPLISIINLLNYFRWDLKSYSSMICKSQVDSIFYSSYQDSNLIEFLICARREKVNLVYILSNWKDIYINNHHQVIPNILSYWSEKLFFDSLRINGLLSSSKFIISGNPTFYPFSNYTSLMSKEDFFLNYGISGDMKVILWAGSMQSLVSDECILIDNLVHFIRDFGLNYRVILRVNPFSNYMFYRNYYQDISEVTVCENNWKRNVEKDITYQTETGELEWSELLFHCDLLVSAPSTVALEATMFNKSIINFIFDSSDCLNQKLLSILESPFYRALVGNGYVNIANNMSELISLLNRNANDLRSDEIISSIPDIISGNRIYNAEVFYTELKETLI